MCKVRTKHPIALSGVQEKTMFSVYIYGYMNRFYMLRLQFKVILGLELAIDPPPPPGGILYTMIFWNYII